MSKEKLKKLIKEKDGYITTQDAEKDGIHRQYLSLFVEEEKLIRTSPGVYHAPEVWDDFLFNYQQKRTKLIYSHDTALYLHGLSDRDPIKYAATVPNGYNTTQIKNKRIIFYTIKVSLFEMGKTTCQTAFGNEIFIYDKERTICDMIRSRNKLDKDMVLESIKKYVKDSNRDLNKLMKYAELLRVKNILRNYLEVLL